jgi:hypothetical protein
MRMKTEHRELPNNSIRAARHKSLRFLQALGVPAKALLGINAGFWLIGMILMGAIVGGWNKKYFTPTPAATTSTRRGWGALCFPCINLKPLTPAADRRAAYRSFCWRGGCSRRPAAAPEPVGLRRLVEAAMAKPELASSGATVPADMRTRKQVSIRWTKRACIFL